MTKQIPQGYKQTKIGIIPEDWEVVKVGEVCDCIVPGRNKPENFDGIIPWVTTPDIVSKYISDTKSNLYISVEEAKKVGSKIVPKNSVIISCVGELGLLSIVKNQIVINQQLHAFLPSDKINTEFLHYALSTQKAYMNRVATKTAVPYMNKDNCNSIPIPRPPLKEQDKIAEILSTWDDAITKQEQLIGLMQVFKKGIMQQIFSQKIRFKDDNGNDYPAWQTKKLGDIAKIIKGVGLSKSDIVSNGNYNCIHYGELFTIYKEQINTIVSRTSRGGTLSKYGDILMPTSDVTPQGLGRASALLMHNVVLGGDINVIRLNQPKMSVFISFQINYKKDDVIKMVSGTTVKHIYAKDIVKLRLNIPQIEEQTKIADFLTSVDDEITKQTEILNQLKLQKQSLMQKLLTGQVRVKYES